MEISDNGQKRKFLAGLVAFWGMISANYSTKCQCKIQKGKFPREDRKKFWASFIAYRILSQLQFCYPYKRILVPSEAYLESNQRAIDYTLSGPTKSIDIRVFPVLPLAER